MFICSTLAGRWQAGADRSPSRLVFVEAKRAARGRLDSLNKKLLLVEAAYADLHRN